ncbi:hypothetical protein ACOME3_004775 [Neoechinorhynchus agilis]
MDLYSHFPSYMQRPNFMRAYPVGIGATPPTTTTTTISKRYPLPPLPPGAILLSDEIIDMNQESSRNNLPNARDMVSREMTNQLSQGPPLSVYKREGDRSFYGSKYRERPSKSHDRLKRRHYRQPINQSNSFDRLDGQQEILEGTSYPPVYKNEIRQEPAKGSTSRIYQKYQRSYSSNSLLDRNNTGKESPSRLYSSDEVRSARNEEREGKKNKKILVPWVDNDESDADQYAQAVATQYSSAGLKVPLTVRVKAMEDTGHSFLKRRAIRLTDNLMCIPAVERVIEKRFYVRKEKKNRSTDTTKDTNVPISQQSGDHLPRIEEFAEDTKANSPTNISGILSEIRSLRNDIAQLQINQAELLSETRSIREESMNKFVMRESPMIRPMEASSNNPNQHKASINAPTINVATNQMPPPPGSTFQSTYTTLESRQSAEYENLKNSLTNKNLLNQQIYPTLPPVGPSKYDSQASRIIRIRPPTQSQSIQHMNTGTNMPSQPPPPPPPPPPPLMSQHERQSGDYTTRGPISFLSQGPGPMNPPKTTNETQSQQLPNPNMNPMTQARNMNYELLMKEAYGLSDNTVESGNANMATESRMAFDEKEIGSLHTDCGFVFYPKHMMEINGLEYLLNSQQEYTDSMDHPQQHFQATTHDANALYYLTHSMDQSNLFSEENGNAFTHEIDMPQSSIVEEVVNQYCSDEIGMKPPLSMAQGQSVHGEETKVDSKSGNVLDNAKSVPSKLYC